MNSSILKKLLAGKIIFLLLLHALVFSYALPHTSVVQIVDTEIKRVDTQNPDATVMTLDVYQIQATLLGSGKPRVFRNEDNWLYFKFNSADMQTLAANAERKDTPVAITSYGWRLPVLSMFPNAISIKEVNADYRHIPIFNIVFLLVYFGGLALIIKRVSKTIAGKKQRREEQRAMREAEERKAQERRALEARATQEATRKSDKDLDDFLNN